MKTSQRGLDFIAKWEGCVLHRYQDQVGLWTIGVGHLIKPGETFQGPITREEALQLLAIDVAKCDRAIAAGIKVELNQNQWDALASWSFNCGTGVLQSSTLARRLNDGHYDEVPALLLNWSKAGGKPNAGLLARRKSEGALWSQPVIDTDGEWHREAEKAYAVSLAHDYFADAAEEPTRDEKTPVA